VLQPIGERSHRFFLLFLISTAFTASYYTCNEAKQFAVHLRSLSPRVNWQSGKTANALIVAHLLLRFEMPLIAFFLVLAIVAVTLIGFILQQAYYVSVNKTQIELDKIDEMVGKWKKEGVKKRYVHPYGHGFVQNWREFLFPPHVQRQPRKSYDAEWEAQQKKQKQETTSKKKN
jgi:hypothetical protein